MRTDGGAGTAPFTVKTVEYLIKTTGRNYTNQRRHRDLTVTDGVLGRQMFSWKAPRGAGDIADKHREKML
jgi:hypothetical protein